MPSSIPGIEEFKRRGIAGNPWFAGLPEPIIDTLIGAARLRTLAAGGLLHARGDPADGCYGVLSGAVRISATAVDGRRIALAVLGPGSWFGEISMIDRQLRSHDAHASGPTGLLIVPAPVIRNLIESDVAIHAHFSRLVCQRLRAMFAAMEDQLFAPLPIRLARRLLMLADAYGADPTVATRLPLGQENIAAMLGVTRQSANVVLRNFASRDLIEVGYGWIAIKDVAELNRLASLQ